MIVADLVKARTNAGRDPALFFVRDSKGFEVDALYAIGRDLRPMEIKSARTFDASLTKSLASFRKLVPDSATPTLIYDGEPYSDRGGVRCLGFRSLSRHMLLDE